MFGIFISTPVFLFGSSGYHYGIQLYQLSHVSTYLNMSVSVSPYNTPTVFLLKWTIT